MQLAVMVIAASNLIATPSLAAGGPHIVDDAGIVAAGNCEFEAFGNAGPGGTWRLVTSPTCAFKALGAFEIGVIAAVDGPRGSIVPGVAAKTVLGRIGALSLAFEASAGFDPKGNQGNYIATNLPATLDLARWLELHANLGLDFQPGIGAIPTFGLAALIEPVAGWQLVGEVAKRRGFLLRSQVGLRYSTPALVYDVLVSRNIDDSRQGTWASFGVTWQFGHGG